MRKDKDSQKDFTKNPTTQEDKYSHADLVAFKKMIDETIDKTGRVIQEITEDCEQYEQKIIDQLQGISNIDSHESQELITSLKEKNNIFIESLSDKLTETRLSLSIFQRHLTTAKKKHRR